MDSPVVFQLSKLESHLLRQHQQHLGRRRSRHPRLVARVSQGPSVRGHARVRSTCARPPATCNCCPSPLRHRRGCHAKLSIPRSHWRRYPAIQSPSLPLHHPGHRTPVGARVPSVAAQAVHIHRCAAEQTGPHYARIKFMQPRAAHRCGLLFGVLFFVSFRCALVICP